MQLTLRRLKDCRHVAVIVADCLVQPPRSLVPFSKEFAVHRTYDRPGRSAGPSLLAAGRLSGRERTPGCPSQVGARSDCAVHDARSSPNDCTSREFHLPPTSVAATLAKLEEEEEEQVEEKEKEDRGEERD